MSPLRKKKESQKFLFNFFALFCEVSFLLHAKIWRDKCMPDHQAWVFQPPQKIGKNVGSIFFLALAYPLQCLPWSGACFFQQFWWASTLKVWNFQYPWYSPCQTFWKLNPTAEKRFDFVWFWRFGLKTRFWILFFFLNISVWPLFLFDLNREFLSVDAGSQRIWSADLMELARPQKIQKITIFGKLLFIEIQNKKIFTHRDWSRVILI